MSRREPSSYVLGHDLEATLLTVGSLVGSCGGGQRTQKLSCVVGEFVIAA